MHTPRLAVFKFASCDGCQLSLLALGGRIADPGRQARHGLFSRSHSRIEPGPYDVALVEGSITTARRRTADSAGPPRSEVPGDDRRLRHRRRNPGPAKLGRFSTSSCGPSMPRRSTSRRSPLRRRSPTTCRSISSCAAARSTSINCWKFCVALLGGRRPRTPVHSVCLDCKRRGTVCVMVAQGVPCLGPVTHAGCGALCPSYDRGCYGCYGPGEQPNLVSLTRTIQAIGVPREASVRSLRRASTAMPPSFAPKATGLPPRGNRSSDSMSDSPNHPRRSDDPRRGRRVASHPLERRANRRSAAQIFEPPRLFEALLRGRSLEDVPDIIARICGICPVAYQMSAVHALEAALGVT